MMAPAGIRNAQYQRQHVVLACPGPYTSCIVRLCPVNDPVVRYLGGHGYACLSLFLKQKIINCIAQVEVALDSLSASFPFPGVCSADVPPLRCVN